MLDLESCVLKGWDTSPYLADFFFWNRSQGYDSVSSARVDPAPSGYLEKCGGKRMIFFYPKIYFPRKKK